MPYPGAVVLRSPSGLVAVYVSLGPSQWPKLREGSHWQLRCRPVKLGWLQA